ncbi:MAG TPA: single-stranded DNA-binding protein [Syntrophomonadaceae bacterium]|nr:single-stranded DNA-binding protein [Syntrophomonadaceae bacterium]HRX21724.1 single-stranded DNA-binding protein [Syntrophomonadaceae bacterium]
MLNRVILIGRLTRDPELRYLQNGTAVATFTLAVNRKYNKEETDFIDIVAWRQLAEHCANYLSKGRLVAVEGRLQIRSYEDKEGQKRKVTEIVADDVRFLEKPGTSSPRSAASSGANDDWEALGREINPEEIDMVDNHGEDDIPF